MSAATPVLGRIDVGEREPAAAAPSRARWSLGALCPRSFAASVAGDDRWWHETQVLVRPRDRGTAVGGPPYIIGRLRFWHLLARDGDDGGDGDRSARTAGVFGPRAVRAIDFRFELGPAHLADEQCAPFHVPGGVPDDGGGPAQRYWPLIGAIRLNGAVAADAPTLFKLRLRIENLTPWASPSGPRAHALRGAFAGAHLLLGVAGGAFVLPDDSPPT